MRGNVNALWRRLWGEDRGRRVFAIYMILVFVIGVTTQGLAVSGADDQAPASDPVAEAPAAEESAAEEPAAEEAPVVEEAPPAGDAPVAETPVVVEEPLASEPPAETGSAAVETTDAQDAVVPAAVALTQIITTTFNDDGPDGAWGNGIYNGVEEEWLGGFIYELYAGPGPDGPWTYVGSAMSLESNGEADFGAQPYGWYKVEQVLTDDQIFNGWECMSNGVQVFQADGRQNAGLWFGIAQRTIIEVYKFSDDDEDGRHDDTEAMLPGWEFTLYDAAGTELRRGVTDGNGKLVFFPVPTGAYRVTETPQAGWENTTPLTRELAINGQCTEVWFGNSRDRGDLEVYKYYDDDEDGVHDGVEDMLEGWEFTLYDAQGAVVSTGKTDANGLLVFSDLTPGDYTVVETLKPGWKNTTSLTQHVVVIDDETVAAWFGNVEFLTFTELDLAITKLADDHTVDEGQLVTYTLTYWNLMTEEDAYDYTIVDDYDERYMTIVNANGGTVADGKISWKFAGPLSYEMGKQTLTYTARVSSDMPEKTTYIDNVVVIDDDRDFNYSNNRDDERVVYRPEGEPFLPFTGGEYRLLFGFAVAAAVLGLLLRLRADNAA